MNFHVVAGHARNQSGQAGDDRAHPACFGARWRVASTLAGLAIALTLGACSSPPKPVVTTVNGSIQGSAQLNPNVNQRPAPLQVRVYELKTAAAFGNADFMALYQNDQATLGADLVAREEMMLQPGESKPIKKTVGPDTKFIGVIGAYRNLEKATWRVVVPVQTGKAQTLTIRAGDVALSADMKAQ
ncbi:type VI secretion system lipoprotein TssJ [Aquabacterium sp.]|uniref:type VI secretion system lipoprotein TssJ n=1 Tax=Aquabacterium sp. TaxID=1872578 RepID=UPI002B548CBE|nr:type VI secretion system lipoprotein TssJ [Aquabacterium sp.]HSW03629.1 type VI secretion system lipoprotein TssJ [Aquabacterium sp.]